MLSASDNFLKMKKIILIQCSKKKLTKPAKAKDLYISQLFKKSLAYADMRNPYKMFILSAKYNLLSLNWIVSPYRAVAQIQKCHFDQREKSFFKITHT